MPELAPTPAPEDEPSNGWDRLLADVTGRPSFVSALIERLSTPLSIDEEARIQAAITPTSADRVPFARCWSARRHHPPLG